MKKKTEQAFETEMEVQEAQNGDTRNLKKGCDMETTKKNFVRRANQFGILLVRSRNPEEDRTGWGALEFLLNNGEIFVLSGSPFGQGEGEGGIWVDMNAMNEEEMVKIRSNRDRLAFEIK